ncbi:MAG: (d)CMP kinase [Candidatus Paceibacteria bacterium]
MAKKSIITIAGAIGSGKSSTAKRVAEDLGYKHFSSGDLFRATAAERGLSVEALNLTAEEQEEIDYEVDELLKKMGREEERLVIDSRLAFHWMPDSFKVYLKLDHNTAAKRIFNHLNTEGRLSQSATSVEDVRGSIDTRVESEQKRYRNLYDIDVSDLSPFDFIIDTRVNSLNRVVELVIENYKLWKNEK